MTAILRVRTLWTGFTGAPGYTNFFFRDFGTGEGGGAEPDAAQATAAMGRTMTFWNAVKGIFPDDVTVTPDPVVDMLEDTTGTLLDSFNASGSAAVKGTDTGAYAAASGAVISWRTAGIRNGRRVRGRTFLVPMSGSLFNTTGGLSPTIQNTLQTAANQLMAPTGTPDFGIYARPSSPGAADGAWFIARQATVPSAGAILTSRRN